MVVLSTEFCGLQLRNPIIVSSCPASETIEGLIKCDEAGAGAVILKSTADYDEQKYRLDPRRTQLDYRGLWATSSFRREVLPKKEGMKLIKEAKNAISIPVIASIAGLTLDIDDWLPICLDAQNAGADMIQLDLFYLPQPITEKNNFERLKELINNIAPNITIPIIPKLSIELPVYLVAEYFSKLPIAGFSLVDSVRVNSPIAIRQKGKTSYNFVENPGMSSVLGKWQFPLTQHYTFILGKHTDLPMCAGGGLDSAQDAIEMMMLGATTVQYATSILINGYGYISKLLSDLESIVDEMGYSSIAELQGLSKGKMSTDIEKCEAIFKNAVANINSDKCRCCYRCLNTAFCNAISKVDEYVLIDKTKCEGCGLCCSLCPDEAIELI